ncbi:MAG: DNA endonuclease [Spirulinaceae cyanobacterium SM2_1_0]|nr:DNA endonuclease [Spirulinaceae cyanobacterium SM2_1_0]
MDFDVTSRVEQRGVIAGMLLGHARRNGDNFFIQHPPQQRDYVEFKQCLLANLTRQGVKVCEQVTSEGDGWFRLQPKAMPLTRVLIQRLYQGDRRVIQRSFLDLLTPLGVAIWFLDRGTRTWKKRADGTVRSLEIVFKVNVPLAEAEAIATYFREVWQLRWGLLRGQRGYRLRAGSQVGRAFLTAIAPWVPACMLDRITPSYNGTATT